MGPIGFKVLRLECQVWGLGSFRALGVWDVQGWGVWR